VTTHSSLLEINGIPEARKPQSKVGLIIPFSASQTRKRLGHNQVSMTMEVYAHVLPDM
jgi:hypothetical protein